MNEFEAIVKAIHEVKEASSQIEITEKTSLLKELGFSSVDVVDLIFELRTMLNIKLNASKLILHIHKQGGVSQVDLRVCDIIDFINNSRAK